MLTTRNYLTCAGDPAGLDVVTEQPHQLCAAPDSERVGSAEHQLADDQAAAPETPLCGPQNVSVLSGPRLELLALNSQLAEASAALARCNQPVARLQQLISDCDAAERELETRQQRHLGEIGEWLAGGANPELRPVEPPELLGAEQHLTRCRRDAAAARNVMVDHTAVAAEAAKLVNELAARRNQAHVLSAVAAAQEFCDAHFRLAFSHYRAAEHRLRNLEDALTLAGHTGAAEQIRQAIVAVKSAPDPKADIQAGQKFLSTLMADPGARL